MNKIQIEIPCSAGPEMIDAFETKTPGLAVHTSKHSQVDGWTITHIRSGLAIMICHDPESAAFIAERLGSTEIDWTAPGKDIIAQIPSMNSFNQWCQEHDIPIGIVHDEPIGPNKRKALEK